MKLGHVRHLHLVGIGGTGMSGIARILLDLGYRITGSDLKQSETVAALQADGAEVHIGHDAAWIEGADVIVRSTAVDPDNVEVAAAHRAHVPVIHRAEMLAELMRLKQGVAVAGAHGKTTTTSLIAHVVESAGLDPTVIIGGRVKTFGDHGKLGRGELLVAEADESDGSFLQLNPVISVINNIDEEHLDYWGDFEQLREGVVAFANRVPFYGTVVLGQDDPRLTELRPRIRRPVRTFGLDNPADVEGRLLESGTAGTSFRVRVGGEDWGIFRLPLAGRHNVRNALAAIAVAAEVGCGPDAVRDALESFGGIERRFEILHEEGRIVVDDYGHHPVELEVTLAAARERWDRPLWAVFQPHRYSRTRDLWDDFRTSLLGSDHLRITEIYPAGEAPIPGVTAEALVDAVHEVGHPDVRFLPFDAVMAELADDATDGSVVLFLGAGSIGKKAREYAQTLA